MFNTAAQLLLLEIFGLFPSLVLQKKTTKKGAFSKLNLFFSSIKSGWGQVFSFWDIVFKQ